MRDLKITPENMNYFYWNMSDEEKMRSYKELNNIFRNRSIEIDKIIFPNEPFIDNNFLNKFNIRTDVYSAATDWKLSKGRTETNYTNILGLTYFNIKDNLQPLDRYIADIKASKEYILYKGGE